MNRTEYLDWAKNRALEYLILGHPEGAIMSLFSDFQKERELVGENTIRAFIELYPASSKNPEAFIKGFN